MPVPSLYVYLTVIIFCRHEPPPVKPARPGPWYQLSTGRYLREGGLILGTAGLLAQAV